MANKNTSPTEGGGAPPPNASETRQVVPVQSFQDFKQPKSFTSDTIVGDDMARITQRMEKLKDEEAKTSLALKVKIGDLAVKMGLGKHGFSAEQLCGGLAWMIQKFGEEGGAAYLTEQGKAWKALHRPIKPKLFICLVEAPELGGELEKRCNEVGLSKDSFGEDYRGKLDVASLIKVGSKNAATVKVTVDEEGCFTLFSCGKLDAEVWAKLTGQPAEQAPHVEPSAVAADEEVLTIADVEGADLPSVEPDAARGAGATSSGGVQNFRKSMQPRGVHSTPKS